MATNESRASMMATNESHASLQVADTIWLEKDVVDEAQALLDAKQFESTFGLGETRRSPDCPPHQVPGYPPNQVRHVDALIAPLIRFLIAPLIR
jgi:hypothetical protein